MLKFMAENVKKGLQFIKSATEPTMAAGIIWFDVDSKIIKVCTGAEWELYGGNLTDAEYADGVLTITKVNGEVKVDLTDMASASKLATILSDVSVNGKSIVAVDTMNEEGLPQLKGQAVVLTAADITLESSASTVEAEIEGLKNDKADKTQVAADIAAAQAADKTAWEAAIAAKNVTASGDSLVSASAEGNEVTVAATDALTEAVGKANSAVQSVVEGDNEGEIKVDGAAVKVHGLGSAAFTNSDAYDAAGTAEAAVTAITGALASNDSKTLKAINEELDAIDSEISSLKSGIAGTTRFNSVIKSLDGELPHIEEVPNDDGSYSISWYEANVEEGSFETNVRHGDFFIILPYSHESQSAGEGKEYIFVVTEEGGPEFVELGDLTPANQRLSAIEASYVKSVATTDGTYVKLTPDAAAKNEVVVTIDDTALANKLGEIEDAIGAAVAGSVASIGGKAGIITLNAPDGDGTVALTIGDDKVLKAEINGLTNVISEEIVNATTHDPLSITNPDENDLYIVSARGVQAAVASTEANAKAYTDSVFTWVTFE